MSRFKMFAGFSFLLQAFAFFVMLVLFSGDKKRKVLALSLLTAGCGFAGVYLLIKGASEYTPSVGCCCERDDDELGIDDEELDGLDFSFSDEDFVDDVAEEVF